MNDQNTAAAQAAGPKLVEVTLTKAHEHAGVRYDAGAKIKVTEPEREYLQRKDIVAGGKKETTR